MRTIKNAIAEIKQNDPNTEFTETALRRMIKEGKIPHCTAGNKVLVNLDMLNDILSGRAPIIHTEHSEGKIRRVF